MQTTGNIVVDLIAALDAAGYDGALVVRSYDHLWNEIICARSKDLELAFDLWRRGQDIEERAHRCPPRSAERVEGIQRAGALYAAALAVLAEMP